MHDIFHCDLFKKALLLFQNSASQKRNKKTIKIQEKGHYFVSILLGALFARVYWP